MEARHDAVDGGDVTLTFESSHPLAAVVNSK